jgi:hypothetical protein
MVGPVVSEMTGRTARSSSRSGSSRLTCLGLWRSAGVIQALASVEVYKRGKDGARMEPDPRRAACPLEAADIRLGLVEELRSRLSVAGQHAEPTVLLILD